MATPTKNRLRELRKAHGLRQIDVASLVDRDQSVVHKYEQGSVPVPMDVARKLADRYETSVEALMGWDREQAA
jgi:transcriptional regulator with XRE-family HTH domain